MRLFRFYNINENIEKYLFLKKYITHNSQIIIHNMKGFFVQNNHVTEFPWVINWLNKLPIVIEIDNDFHWQSKEKTQITDSMEFTLDKANYKIHSEFNTLINIISNSSSFIFLQSDNAKVLFCSNEFIQMFNLQKTPIIFEDFLDEIRAKIIPDKINFKQFKKELIHRICHSKSGFSQTIITINNKIILCTIKPKDKVVCLIYTDITDTIMSVNTIEDLESFIFYLKDYLIVYKENRVILTNDANILINDKIEEIHLYHHINFRSKNILIRKSKQKKFFEKILNNLEKTQEIIEFIKIEDKYKEYLKFLCFQNITYLYLMEQQNKNVESLDFFNEFTTIFHNLINTLGIKNLKIHNKTISTQISTNKMILRNIINQIAIKSFENQFENKEIIFENDELFFYIHLKNIAIIIPDSIMETNTGCKFRLTLK